MTYLERNIDKRYDPRLWTENAKSVITVLFNYFPKQVDLKTKKYRIAKYAYGKDYHDIISSRLKFLLVFIKEKDRNVQGKIFVDTSPVMDKVWAKECGLGWIGKNTCLISKKYGSFSFIGGIMLNIELSYDKPSKNHCGTCVRCIKACPTGALVAPYMLDARKCISYLTIEHKGTLPDDLIGKFDNWIFGCDICQDICPWNKKSVPHKITELEPIKQVMDLLDIELSLIDEATFNRYFKSSAIIRLKYCRLIRNISAANPKMY